MLGLQQLGHQAQVEMYRELRGQSYYRGLEIAFLKCFWVLHGVPEREEITLPSKLAGELPDHLDAFDDDERSCFRVKTHVASALLSAPR